MSFAVCICVSHTHTHTAMQTQSQHLVVFFQISFTPHEHINVSLVMVCSRTNSRRHARGGAPPPSWGLFHSAEGASGASCDRSRRDASPGAVHQHTEEEEAGAVTSPGCRGDASLTTIKTSGTRSGSI